jgi:hypothetical protein
LFTKFHQCFGVDFRWGFRHIDRLQREFALGAGNLSSRPALRRSKNTLRVFVAIMGAPESSVDATPWLPSSTVRLIAAVASSHSPTR